MSPGSLNLLYLENLIVYYLKLEAPTVRRTFTLAIALGMGCYEQRLVHCLVHSCLYYHVARCAIMTYCL